MTCDLQSMCPACCMCVQEVGDDVRQVLEDALHTHCTLTEGDTLVVPHGDKKYDLRVSE